MGVLAAVGWAPAAVRRNVMIEMLCVAVLGAWWGVQLGVGYAAAMVYGLTTWWVGAISRPFLKLHVSPLSLIIGLLVGTIVCAITIWWSLRSAAKQSTTSLLAGRLEENSIAAKQKPARRWIVWALAIVAAALSLLATSLAGEAQAGAFMGAGFLVLAAMLLFALQWLKHPQRRQGSSISSLFSMANRAASRNPLRSTLTIGLVAVASFLIVAVSSFRLTPSEAGTAGFDWIATSSQPIIDPIELPSDLPDDLQKIIKRRKCSRSGIRAVKTPVAITCTSQLSRRCWAFRKRSSIRLTIQIKINRLRSRGVERRLPVKPNEPIRGDCWIRKVHAGTEEDPIPVLIDKNTANYSLKIYLPGTQFQVDYDSGETVHFVAVGFLENTILQGALIASEQDFLKGVSVSGRLPLLLDPRIR